MFGVFSSWREWLNRYGLAEIWGTVASYAGYFLGHHLSDSQIVGAYSAALAENVGYYGCILWREIVHHRKQGHAVSIGLASTVLRDLFYEFGLAELLDSFIVRPAATFLSVTLFGATAGVFVGKVSADLVFYALAIGFYERRKAKGGGSCERS